MKIIEHKHPGSGMGNDFESAFEYLLPVSEDDLPPQIRESISPWTRRFLSKTPEEILEIFKADWSAFESPITRRFTDFVQRGTPRGIAFNRHQKGFYMWLVITVSEERDLFIPEPKILTTEEKCFLQSFEGAETVVDFCTHFHECREWDPWANALFFSTRPHSDKEYIADFSNRSQVFEDATAAVDSRDKRLTDWEGGICIYFNDCGDTMLLSADGRIAQSLHEIVWGGDIQRGTVHVLNSLDEFIRYYIEYLQNPSDPRLKLLFQGDYAGELDLI